MRNEVIWAIRDARGLTAQEKSFLFVVESRGEMTTTATRAAGDMGLSRATYYRVRDALLTKKCLTVRQRGENTSVYVVNEVSLSETHVSHTETLSSSDDTEEVSHTETPLSHTETLVSHTETEVSHCDNTKKNKEEIEEEVEEERQSPVADAPVDNELRGKGHLFLNSMEKKEVQRWCRAYRLNEEEMIEAVGLTTREGRGFEEALDLHLNKKGVNRDEW